jgi:hypothetical protein
MRAPFTSSSLPKQTNQVRKAPDPYAGAFFLTTPLRCGIHRRQTATMGDFPTRFAASGVVYKEVAP